MVGENKTVLVIDNDQNTLELYQRFLKRFYRVISCSNESDALELAQNHHVATIVLEPASPGGQGWALLEKLRTMPQTTGIPIILCSTQDARRRGTELGATLFLLKPVLPNVLHAAIRQVLVGTARAT
ncbi:MAG: response regulator [Chloroflexi bacterium]|nr:response regulator [Chloroflexota bacterium]